MEAEKKRSYGQVNRAYWSQGSAARKVMEYPNPEAETENVKVQEESRREERQPKADFRFKPKAEQNITLGSMIVLLAAMAITLYTCFGYLKVQADIVVANKAIKSLEKEYEALKTRNDAAYSDVIAAVDFDEVYQVAVRDLGMVFPNKNETVSYTANQTGYVRQFADIPESERFEILKSLLP